jgi:hypothetical protein
MVLYVHYEKMKKKDLLPLKKPGKLLKKFISLLCYSNNKEKFYVHCPIRSLVKSMGCLIVDFLFTMAFMESSKVFRLNSKPI